MPYRRPPSDDLGEEEPTRVDDENITPVEPPLCVECGHIVTLDSFLSHPSYPTDHCVSGATGKWHSCATLRKAVFYW